jgi:hypothetical protein
MATATVKGVPHSVRVVRDLDENWSLEVFPTPAAGAIKTSEPFKNWPVPLCMKLRADSREHAIVAGLEHMKKLGKIDAYHVEESEKPPAAPPPGAAAKKKDDEEEEAG